MYFTNDYIMRMIEIAIHGLASLVFNRQIPAVLLFDEAGNPSSSGLLYHRLKKLLQLGEINEAENLLFEEIERNPLDAHLQTAIQFYQDIAQLTDEALQSRHFSRDEVLEGVVDVGRIYGVDLTQYLF